METCRVLGNNQKQKASVFVYVKSGGKAKKGKRKAAAEVWCAEMRGSPQRRDVAGLCLQATETQDTVVLFISICAFIMVCHNMPET